MTSEAPEQNWVEKADELKRAAQTVCVMLPHHSHAKHDLQLAIDLYELAAEESRADLHQQALKAAEARGYARAVEDATSICQHLEGLDTSGNGSAYEEGYTDGCSQSQEAIRALSPTPADPVAEAARVSRVFVHKDTDKGDIFAFTTTGDNGEKLASAITRLEGWAVFDHHEYQVTTVEDAIRALAQKEGE